MKKIDKSLMRLAIAVHARLAANKSNEAAVELPNQAWQQCTELAGRIRRAKLRGWHLAAKTLGGDLAQVLPVPSYLMMERAVFVFRQLSVSTLFFSNQRRRSIAHRGR